MPYHTIRQLLYAFIQFKTIKGCSHHTALAFSGNLERFFGFAKITEIAGITLDSLLEFEKHLIDQGNTHRTVNQYLIALRSFLTFVRAKHTELPCLDPETIELHKEEERTINVLTTEQVDRLLSQTHPDSIEGKRDRAMILLMYASGVRLSEILNLDRKDIDLSGREIFIRGGKGDKDRWTFFDQQTEDAIVEYFAARRDTHTPLFINHQGKNLDRGCRLTPRSIQRKIAEYGESAGLSVRVYPHLLRHSACSYWIENDMPFPYVMRLMGHARAQTTMRYIDIKKNKMREHFDRIHKNPQKTTE